MSAIAMGARPPVSRRSRWGLVAIAVTASVLFGLYAAAQWLGTAPTAALTMPSNPAIEDRWGIRVTHVGVSADGGMVDVRFIVLDSDKAQAMMQDPANLPILESEVDGRRVGSAAMMSTKHEIAPGRSSFLLYRNTLGAVVAGQPIRLEFDDLAIEHAPVE